MLSKYPVRVLLTLVVALAGALLCVRLQTPLPWMIGPMLATALVSMLKAPTVSWLPLRCAGQSTMGIALGLYFTPTMAALVVRQWWAIGLSIGWTILLGLFFGAWLHHRHAKRLPGFSRSTSYFAGGIGAASEMTLLAERASGRTDLVAAAHSMRVLIVTILIPFALQYSGIQGLDLSQAVSALDVRPLGLLWLALAACAGALVFHLLNGPNPWFMGSLLTSMGLTIAGFELSAVPKELSNAAQLLIGISLGVRFTPAFVHTAPSWLLSVATGTLLLILLSTGFAWLLALGTGLPLATMVLGNAPGGIAEMAITAKVLQLGAPVVTAFQVCRLVAVMVLQGPLYERLYGQRS